MDISRKDYTEGNACKRYPTCPGIVELQMAVFLYDKCEQITAMECVHVPGNGRLLQYCIRHFHNVMDSGC